MQFMQNFDLTTWDPKQLVVKMQFQTSLSKCWNFMKPGFRGGGGGDAAIIFNKHFQFLFGKCQPQSHLKKFIR